MGDRSDQAQRPEYLPPQPEPPPSQEIVPGQSPYAPPGQYQQPQYGQPQQYQQLRGTQTAQSAQVPLSPQTPQYSPQQPQIPQRQFPPAQYPREQVAPGEEQTVEGPAQLPRSQWRSVQYRHDTETLKKAGPGTFALIVGFVSGICGLLAAGITFVYIAHEGDPEATLAEIRETVITGGLVGVAIGAAVSVALLVYGRR